MEKKTELLKIYLFSGPLLSTEWLSLLGDKYVHALKFTWEYVKNPDEADIIVWDGVISPKLSLYADKIVARLEVGKVLLLTGEARTLYENHPFVKLLKLNQLRYVEVPGWSVLPEELLLALTTCHQKLGYV
jgi:Ni,Fe-hydrogenase III small subunit